MSVVHYNSGVFYAWIGGVLTIIPFGNSSYSSSGINSPLVIEREENEPFEPILFGRQPLPDYIALRDRTIDLLSGQIKFPASQNASSDVNTLDDYEEGTWTPVDTSGAGLTFAFATGNYIKIGSFVMVHYQVVFPATADISNASIGGLPFVVRNIGNTSLAVGYNASGPANFKIFAQGNTAITTPSVDQTGGPLTNANFSNANIVVGGTYTAVN